MAILERPEVIQHLSPVFRVLTGARFKWRKKELGQGVKVCIIKKSWSNCGLVNHYSVLVFQVASEVLKA